MKVTGDATLHAPVAAVWAALTDPAVLVQAIPGCERLTATAPDTYELTVTAAVGTITGTYTGEISLSDQQPPAALLLKATGAGTPGTVTTSVRVTLSGDGDSSTDLTYDADATIAGLIANVGQRMLTAVAKRQAAQFFTALDDLLLAQAPGVQPEPSAVPGRQPAGAAGVSPPTVPGQPAAGAAGVSSATVPPAAPATGETWERPPMKGQPAGRRWAAPRAGAGFLPGVLVGAAVALAGVAVGAWITRGKR